MVELKKLIDEKGLISYQIEGQALRTLEGKNPTDDDAEIKGWIAQDFGKVLGVDENFTLAKLNGKTVKATVKFKSTDANCPLETSDEYSVTFVTADAPTEEISASAVVKSIGVAYGANITLVGTKVDTIEKITINGKDPIDQEPDGDYKVYVTLDEKITEILIKIQGVADPINVKLN